MKARLLPADLRLGVMVMVLVLASTPFSAASAGDLRLSQQQTQADARTFVEQMLLSDLTDVQLGRLAVKQASGADVKAFGQTMASEHSAADEELMLLAAQMNLSIPTQLDEAHRAIVNRMAGLRNTEFDRAFIETTVQRHRDAMTALRSRASDGRGGKGDQADNDRLLAQWATRVLPIVERHLRHAEDLQRRLSAR